MSENDLRSVNNIPPRMLIKAGSTLLVPRSAKNETDVSSQVADNAQMSLAPELVTRRTTMKARKGETVASIAKRYGLNSVDVAEWNNIGVVSAFKLGQEVVVYLPVSTESGKEEDMVAMLMLAFVQWGFLTATIATSGTSGTSLMEA